MVRDSGLVPAGSGGVALLSGGPDSACLAAGLVEHLGRAAGTGREGGSAGAGGGGAGGAVVGLHLNYGLREGSDADEARCRELCERLGIELLVERPELGEGNLQAAAREARYAAAERLRASRGLDWIATGHTRTDLAETVLYRLAVSPGSRALLGLPARRGRLVRPLLAIGRAEARAAVERAGLPFAEDPSNLDPRFARARVRSEILPVLRELSATAEDNIAATRAELEEEAEALDALAAELLEEAAGGGAAAVRAEALSEAPAALRRRALRTLAERAAGRPVALGRPAAEEIWRLARRPEGGELDLGGGVRAVCEAGFVRFGAEPGAETEPAPVTLPVPGETRFGRWLLRAELRESAEPRGPEVATLDAAALGTRVEVRAWREGDRMRPLGLGGSKNLQDLFTDAGVPRSLRRTLPVVVAAGRIAWVAGVAVSEEFRLSGRGAAVLITASLADPG
ncbi:MAG: tRNA lysidine(34) synthetase TilS [Solirubrobacterales bacterium]